MLNVYKITHNSKIYGPGMRDVIWFKGCSLHCKNCINHELWSKTPFNLLSVGDLLQKIESKHVTLLGGEPLEQEDILSLIKGLKRKDVGVLLFTGYEKDELSGEQAEAASLCDAVIYGRYIEELKDDSLYLRGSLNQTISLNTNKYDTSDFTKPNSFELNINGSYELRGRTKTFLNDLLGLNR